MGETAGAPIGDIKFNVSLFGPPELGPAFSFELQAAGIPNGITFETNGEVTLRSDYKLVDFLVLLGVIENHTPSTLPPDKEEEEEDF